MGIAEEVLKGFRMHYASNARVYRAPGRVNLIGEHTDYNDGFVLPAAIGFSCWVAIAPREDRKLVLHSENLSGSVEADLDSLAPPASGKWFDYPLGVAWALEQAGMRLRGANINIRGDVPLGSGLSSSAAVEVATGYALLDTSGHAVDRTLLAKLCQRAENEYVGARTGIMDQFISCHGRAGQALLLDCRSLEFRLLKLPPHVHLVICNTMVKHEHGTGGYNARRAECEEAMRALAPVLPGIRALRDVTLADLEKHRDRLTETTFKRSKHIVTENYRVVKAASAFEAGDLKALTELMGASHKSLRDDYEVSCEELDIMVEIASKQRGVYGARMTGGGFGGCTINLVADQDSEEFRRAVGAEYEKKTGLRPDIYICEASQGAEALDLNGTAMNSQQAVVQEKK
jgi:galactokinase